LIAKASYWQRAALIVGGIGLIDPGVVTDILGAGIAAIVIATQVITRRTARETIKAAE
jgi:UPF0716 family protein affecting phage T7 exclusion